MSSFSVLCGSPSRWYDLGTTHTTAWCNLKEVNAIHLHSGQGIAIIITPYKSVLLVNPRLLFIKVGTELLVSQRLIQFVLPEKWNEMNGYMNEWMNEWTNGWINGWEWTGTGTEKKSRWENTTNATAPVRLRAWLLRNTPRCRKNVYEGLENAYYL